MSAAPSTATPPGSADASAPATASDGAWIYPLREAVITTRAALVVAASVLSLTLLGVLAVLGAVVVLGSPGTVAWWSPLALLPLAIVVTSVWRVRRMPWPALLGLALVAAAGLGALTVSAALSPTIFAAGTAGFTLSMASNVVVLTGTVADRWTGGLAGAVVGYLLGAATVALTAALVGLPYRLDLPPLAITIGLAVCYLVFPLARRRARGGTEALERADRRTRARRLREVEGRESIAALHDSLLGELAVLARRSPGPLDDGDRARLTAALESSAVLPMLRTEPPATPDGMAAWLASVGRAGGLRLHLDGRVELLDTLPDATLSAVRAALEQCLVNVMRHAGVDEAWLAVAATAEELSVTVVDEGVGFDPDAVPRDRLGLSESVRGRIERCGGTVRLWSSPGSGTSVHLVVPAGGGAGGVGG